MIVRLLLLLLCSSAAVAQTNFSGTWNLQNKQHVLGPEYGNALASAITFQQQTDSLIIESVSVGAEGQEVKSRSAVSMDGKSLTALSKNSNRKYIKSLKWSADKKSLVITTVFYVEDNPNEVDLTRVEILSLSPDGKQLNLEKKSIETRSENWEVKGTYAKKTN
ncbi:hypothetical protein [Paraflavitalea sp. CAU 1676]|uniref:hypothetical protein n=1 Tax=Paraflavitalea sp. CAU 1676 TaxID=3032598 RepID=UPI0023DCA47D|nr:hypothetical protein [Paraflavitalea sp. CAU 1676]MDF2192597.1 hypothetical protein [Paraflavitalea sp. CAU 1676]